MKLDGYIRVSKVNGREGDSFQSPKVQRDAIQRHADAMGHTIVKWHTDLDQSGAKTSRPAFDQMMARVEAGSTEGVVVAKIDRFGRSLVGALDGIQRIESGGGHFISTADSFDTTTPNGRLVMNMMLSIAQFELERIAATWKESRRRANERGVYRATAPFGYARTLEGRLEPDANADLVREMFERKARGATLASIAEWLNEAGVMPPSGQRPSKRAVAKQWVRTSVKDMLTNRAYLGITLDGEFVNEGSHEALVDLALFEAAKGRPARQSKAAVPYLLSGVIRCASCGYGMSGGMSGNPGERVRHYYCKRKHGAGDCPRPAAIRAKFIEPWIVEHFLERIEGVFAMPTREGKDYKALTEQAKRAEAERDAFIADTEARSLMGDDAWRKGLKARVDAVKLAERALSEARMDATGIELPPVADLHEWWPSLPVESQKLYLAQAIDAVMVKATGRGKGNFKPVEERSRILWRGEAPDDLPRRGRTNTIRPYVFAPDHLPEIGNAQTVL